MKIYLKDDTPVEVDRYALFENAYKAVSSDPKKYIVRGNDECFWVTNKMDHERLKADGFEEVHP